MADPTATSAAKDADVPESAIRQLRGILAATHTGAAIEQLLADVADEIRGRFEPAPYYLSAAGMAGPVFCFHPNVVTEYRGIPGRWVRKWSGRRWRRRWIPPYGVHAMRCPDCPAEMFQLDPGVGAVWMRMGPSLVWDGPAASRV
jgi:hypothetical protein